MDMITEIIKMATALFGLIGTVINSINQDHGLSTKANVNTKKLELNTMYVHVDK